MRADGAVVIAILSNWLFFGQPAFAEKRVALVMGNSAYQNVNRLANPANDASAISETFRSVGFDVVELKRDLNVSEMRHALRDFSDTVRDADIAIVYYAGHGIEIDGTNYVIPVDAVLERDIDAFDEAIPLDRILTVIEPAKQLRLIILDACRDNPFNKTMKRTIGMRAIGRGLAKVEPTGPNTLIAFAAKAGSTASDGDGKNSPFTTALIKYLPRPGLDLRKAFGFARDEVLKATNNKQEPFIYGSLGGDDVALVPAAIAQPAAASSADPNSAARHDYELALQISTKPVWDSFISNYPSGFYTDLAKAQRDRLSAEIAGIAAAEKARAALDEQKRLAAEGARMAEQAKAAEQAKVAEDARVAAEKKKAIEDARVAEAERAKAAAQAKAEEVARVAADKAKAAAEAKAAEQVRAAEKQKATDDAKAAQAEALLQARRDSEARGNTVVALAPATGGVVAPGPATAAAPAIDPADIARLLQAHLKRVGCDPGALDGNWTEGSKTALDQFNRHAHATLDIKIASLEALEVVRGTTGRVCPLVCGKGTKLAEDRCLAITCDQGFMLGSDGACHKRPLPPEHKRVARAREEALRARALPLAPASPAPREHEGQCNGQSGFQFCH
jgi:uncharacterized caspase-like protein